MVTLYTKEIGVAYMLLHKLMVIFARVTQSLQLLTSVAMVTANRQPQNTSRGMKCYHGDINEKLIDWVTALVQLQTQLSNYATTPGQNRQEK